MHFLSVNRFTRVKKGFAVVYACENRARDSCRSNRRCLGLGAIYALQPSFSLTDYNCTRTTRG